MTTITILDTAAFANMHGTPFLHHRVRRDGAEGWVLDTDLAEARERTQSGAFLVELRPEAELGRRFVSNGNLHDYRTGAFIRPATAEELVESLEAAEDDGGSGVFEIEDGRVVFVTDEVVGGEA